MTELHEEGEVANGDPKRDKMRTKQTIRRTTIKKTLGKRKKRDRKRGRKQQYSTTPVRGELYRAISYRLDQ